MCSKTAPHQDRGYFLPENLAQALYFLYLLLKSHRSRERFPSVVSKAIRTTFLFMYFLYIACGLSEVCLLRLLRKKTPIKSQNHILWDKRTHTGTHTGTPLPDVMTSSEVSCPRRCLTELKRTDGKKQTITGAFCSHGACCWLTTLCCVSACVRPEVPDCALVDITLCKV